MESAPKTFMFVNKTQSSRVLSRAEDAERIHVQSHLQQARRSRENTAAAANHPWIVAAHAANSGRQGKARLVQTTASSENLFLTTTSSVMEVSRRRIRQSQTLTQCQSRNGSDPFDCTIAGTDISHHHHAILVFISGPSPKITFFAEAFAPAGVQRRPLPLHMRHDAAVTSRLRRCVRDEALMYSTLAYGANSLGWMGGVVGAFEPAGYFTVRAIQAVRERIAASSASSRASTPDTQLALSIYSLAISELWKVMPLMRNRGSAGMSPRGTQPKQMAPTARMHLQALPELVQSAGGWRAFDPYVIESAILVDKYLACWEWTTPTIAVNSLPAEYSLPIPEFDHGASALGSKLLSMDLDPRIKGTIEQIVRYVYHAKQAWALAPLPFDVQSSLFSQLQRLIYELLSCIDLQPVDNCVRVAALVFLQASIVYRGAHICAATLVEQLRPALVSARFWEDAFDPGLRFWCIVSALLLTEPSPDDAWFNAMLVRYFGSVSKSSSTLRDVQACLEQYLYLDERQGGHLAAVIERIGRVTTCN